MREGLREAGCGIPGDSKFFGIPGCVVEKDQKVATFFSFSASCMFYSSSLECMKDDSSRLVLFTFWLR